MSTRHRQLLPAPVAKQSSIESGSGSGSGSRGGPGQPRELKPSRIKSRTACNPCRARKSACDGRRPSCTKCLELSRPCVYRVANQDIRRQLHNHAEILDQLITLAEPEAVQLLQQLRSSSDLPAIIAAAQGDMHQKARPSQLETARAVSPPTASLIEFELLASHQNLYHKLPPVNTSLISFSPLHRQPPSLLDASDTTKEPSRVDPNPASAGAPPAQEYPRLPRLNGPAATSSPVHGPYLVQPLCDARLYQLRIEYWTRVSISNDFAACIISSYLMKDHPLLGLFDADLFVGDLVAHRLEFCSAFLLNSLMYYACHLYAAVDSRSLPLAPAFLAQAQMLWRAEHSCNSLSTLAGVELLCMMMSGQGRDVECQDMFREGRQMAERMQLFGVEHNVQNAASFAQLSDRAKKATAHTAWGVYNWITHHDSFYQDSEPIYRPPMFPIPGDHRKHGTNLLGIDWPAHPLPDYVGLVFPAMCRFWSIMQEVAAVYLAPHEVPLPDRVPIAFAEAKYQKLLAWSDDLPNTVAARAQSGAFTLLLHFYFHGAVIHIFRPFQSNEETLRLGSFSSADAVPKAIFVASLNQLKRLVLLLHLHHTPTEHSLWLSSALIHVFGALLRSVDDKEWAFYFQLALHIGVRLRTWYEVFGPILQGTLAMAVRDKAMSSSDAKNWSSDLEANHGPAEATDPMRESNTQDSQVGNTFMLDMDLAMVTRRDAAARSLALQFEEMTFFSEFLNDGD